MVEDICQPIGDLKCQWVYIVFTYVAIYLTNEQ